MTGADNYNIQDIMSHFDLLGDFTDAAPYGNGHINDTFAVNYLQAGVEIRYILQRINGFVFKEPEKLMENVGRICDELQRQLKADGVPDPSRRALTNVNELSGLPYYKDPDGNVWRVYLFIEGAVGFDIIENEEQAYQAAAAFGEFQKLLTNIPGGRLHETIPGFHDTPKRFGRFREVLLLDAGGRAESAGSEIDFFLSYESQVGRLLDLHRQGLIPERVTHNDTKLNNVLIDLKTHEAVCVIDLDTSMPGLAPYDFGDLVRTSTTSTAEDETDLSKIVFLPEMFKATIRGYLSTAGDFLTKAELDNLVFGGILMTYEVGLRFLTDYLKGDVYFKTAYSEHNLIRCRTQMTLVKLMEENRDSLEKYALEEYNRLSS